MSKTNAAAPKNLKAIVQSVQTFHVQLESKQARAARGRNLYASLHIIPNWSCNWPFPAIVILPKMRLEMHELSFAGSMTSRSGW
jgi:hypothetical protein